jgi:hypothetical protein
LLSWYPREKLRKRLLRIFLIGNRYPVFSAAALWKTPRRIALNLFPETGTRF